MKATRLPNAKILVALGVTCLALAAAGPASATDNAPAPEAKKQCMIKVPPRTVGGPWTYGLVDHGTTIQEPGSTKKQRCNDGKWEDVKAFEAPSTGTFTVVSGAYQLIAP